MKSESRYFQRVNEIWWHKFVPRILGAHLLFHETLAELVNNSCNGRWKSVSKVCKGHWFSAFSSNKQLLKEHLARQTLSAERGKATLQLALRRMGYEPVYRWNLCADYLTGPSTRVHGHYPAWFWLFITHCLNAHWVKIIWGVYYYISPLLTYYDPDLLTRFI